MRKILLAFAILSLFSCERSKDNNTQKKKHVTEVADYKEYFSPTAFDGKPRFYLFDETAVFENKEGVNSKAIRSIRKSNDSTLIAVEYTQYADTVVRTDSSVMVMRNDGIYYKTSFINGGEDWLELQLDHALSIPWQWKKDSVLTFGWTSSKDGVEMRLESKRAFTGFKEKTLKPFGKVKVAIREDKQLRVTGGKSRMNGVVMWDVPGFGLYHYEIVAKDYSYVMEFEKELSESEYNALMGR